MTKESELRKHQHTMVSVGTGIMFFGLWSVVKTILYFLLNDTIKDTVNQVEDMDNPESIAVVYAIAWALVLFLVLLDLCLRWNIGRTVREYGMGIRDKIGILFYVALVIVILIDIVEVGLEIFEYTSADVDLIDNTVTLLVDMTSLITLFELIAAIFLMYKIRWEMEQQGGDLSHAA